MNPSGFPTTWSPSTQALRSGVVHLRRRRAIPGPIRSPRSPSSRAVPTPRAIATFWWSTPATARDYELYAAHPVHKGKSWRAGSGAVFPLGSDALRPAGWTSADAAGLPILPGLVRPDEVAAGVIDHAIRVTVPASDDTYIWPARHEAGTANASLPPMGLRLRLKASVDISQFPPMDQVILQALKTYGMIVADNGSPWFISGVPSSYWNNTTLHDLTADHRLRLRGGGRVVPDGESGFRGHRSGSM